MTKAVKSVTREYFTKHLRRPNAFGQTEVACSRKVVTWTLIRSDGSKVEGFARKRDALAAA